MENVGLVNGAWDVVKRPWYSMPSSPHSLLVRPASRNPRGKVWSMEDLLLVSENQAREFKVNIHNSMGPYGTHP